MNKPYIVFVDNLWGGRLDVERFSTFEAACENFAARRLTPHLELHNEDGYDVDCSDGLDSEQRDIVWSGGVP